MALPSLPHLWAFLIASVVLAVTPGPGVMFILARSLTQGRRYGLASVAGVACGNLGNALGAALGLAALFAVSSLAFALAKYAGAAYLIYLGVQAIRSGAAKDAAMPLEPGSLRRIFRDGFLVALLNPKTSVFFAAFLPQFMDAGVPHIAQSVTLGTLFVLIACVSDTVYALAASTLAPRIARSGRLRGAGRYLAGGTFIGLGVLTALSGTKAAPQGR